MRNSYGDDRTSEHLFGHIGRLSLGTRIAIEQVMSMEIGAYVAIGDNHIQIDLHGLDALGLGEIANPRIQWRVAARLYLEAFACTFDGEQSLIKSERRAIGAAWKLADDNGGRIVFYVS